MPDVFPATWINNRKQHWLNARFPRQRTITLDIKRIFIIPAVSSLALLSAVLILLLMAINFQSSLIYGLSFWLLALMVVVIFFTYRNLSGFTIKVLKSEPCFAGEKAVFELAVSSSGKHDNHAIQLGWKNEDSVEVNLQAGVRQQIKLSASTRQRGIYRPQRLHIVSRYPTGLVVAWSYAQLDMHSIVYPEPRLQKVRELGNAVADSSEQGAEIPRGTTDFGGVSEYQAGDSLRHIHWKTYAKTGDLHTKRFVDFATHERWLNWHELNIPGTEDKLSHLSARILQCDEQQLEYGLRIPGMEIPPASGEAHKHRCLRALALYGLEES